MSALLDEPLTCTPAMLSGACKGPWAYRAYTTPCYNERRDPLCPKEWYDEARVCLVARAGLQAQHVADVTCHACTIPQLNTRCQQEATWYRGTVAGAIGIVTSSAVISDAYQSGADRYGTCTVTLTNAGVAQDLACGTSPAQRDGLCRLPAFGEAPKGQCGNESADRASAPGLTRPALLAAQPYLNPAFPTDCSTQEDLALSTARLTTSLARTSATHSVWENLPASAAEEQAARRELARSAKLLYELGTVPASPAELDQLRALYTSQPDQALSCGVLDRPQVSAGCRAAGLGNGLEGALELCTRMLSSHVAGAVFAVEADRCFELLVRPELRAAGCGAEYRALIETVTEQLFTKALAGIARPPGATELQGLDAALRRIDRWYASAALAFAGAGAELDDATGRVLLAFWKRVYEVGAPLPASFPSGQAGTEATKASLAALTSQRLEADRQVLAAAFADPAPPRSPPRPWPRPSGSPPCGSRASPIQTAIA
jgi:hypothetical protein